MSHRSLLSIGIILTTIIIPSDVLFAASISQFSENGKGILTVTSESIASGSLPRGATNVPMLSLRFSASCDADISLQNLTIIDRGLGNADDIIGVSFFEGIKRITRSKTLDQTKSVKVMFPSSFVIPKCKERAVIVMANIAMDAASSGEHQLMLDEKMQILSSAKKINIMQENGEENRITIRPKNAGKITVAFLSVRELLQYGRRETVARIQLSADALSDHYLRSMLLTNEEDARDYNLQNLSLETRTGKQITFLKKSMKGREIFLEFNPPFLLEKSQTVVLLLKADMKSSLRKVRFTVKEAGDVNAREAQVRR